MLLKKQIDGLKLFYCLECRKSIFSTRNDIKYCSNACKQKSYRIRNDNEPVLKKESVEQTIIENNNLNEIEMQTADVLTKQEYEYLRKIDVLEKSQADLTKKNQELEKENEGLLSFKKLYEEILTQKNNLEIDLTLQTERAEKFQEQYNTECLRLNNLVTELRTELVTVKDLNKTLESSQMSEDDKNLLLAVRTDIYFANIFKNEPNSNELKITFQEIADEDELTDLFNFLISEDYPRELETTNIKFVQISEQAKDDDLENAIFLITKK